jgi:ligand-binding sensor domain-containing protein
MGTLGGVSRFDGDQISTLTRHDGLPHDWVGALAESHDGDLWIGTEGGGLCRFDGDALVRSGIGDDIVQALAADSRESLWIGTRTGLRQHESR